MASSQRYAVIQGGQITSVILWDGVSTYTPPTGATLTLEADAIAAGIPRAAVVDFTAKAQAAIAVNRANAVQDATIATQADAVANGTTALTLAQLTTTVRQLAQAVAVLARNDIQGSRQRTATILRMLSEYDDTNA